MVMVAGGLSILCDVDSVRCSSPGALRTRLEAKVSPQWRVRVLVVAIGRLEVYEKADVASNRYKACDWVNEYLVSDRLEYVGLCSHSPIQSRS